MWAASGRRIPEYFPPCVPEHGVALFGFILRLVAGDRQRAEDVVHETLLRAWKHPAALHPYRENPRPWLFTVARHLVIDERRARRTSPAVPSFTRLRHSWYGVSLPPVMPTAGEGARPSVRGKRQSPPRGGSRTRGVSAGVGRGDLRGVTRHLPSHALETGRALCRWPHPRSAGRLRSPGCPGRRDRGLGCVRPGIR